MPDQQPHRQCCGRCVGLPRADRSARRRVYRDALSHPGPSGPEPSQPPDPWATPGESGSPNGPASVATGTAVDASPHTLRIAGPDGERSFALLPGTRAWRGKTADPTAIRPGEQVVVRLVRGRRGVADKVWAGIGRVTGTIVDRDDDELLVDEGITRSRQRVTLPRPVINKIMVRFPRLEPAHLIDVIGLRRGELLEAALPAATQPPAVLPEQIPHSVKWGRNSDLMRGSVTWHEPAHPGEPDQGAAYPEIDPWSGCPETPAASARSSTPALPFLAIGSLLAVRNECAHAAGTVTVTTCAAIARLFSDRCLTCGTSPRGRIADLTMSSFVALGGELERACFNATVAVG